MKDRSGGTRGTKSMLLQLGSSISRVCSCFVNITLRLYKYSGQASFYLADQLSFCSCNLQIPLFHQQHTVTATLRKMAFTMKDRTRSTDGLKKRRSHRPGHSCSNSMRRGVRLRALEFAGLNTHSAQQPGHHPQSFMK